MPSCWKASHLPAAAIRMQCCAQAAGAAAGPSRQRPPDCSGPFVAEGHWRHRLMALPWPSSCGSGPRALTRPFKLEYMVMRLLPTSSEWSDGIVIHFLFGTAPGFACWWPSYMPAPKAHAAARADSHFDNSDDVKILVLAIHVIIHATIHVIIHAISTMVTLWGTSCASRFMQPSALTCIMILVAMHMLPVNQTGTIN